MLQPNGIEIVTKSYWERGLSDKNKNNIDQATNILGVLKNDNYDDEGTTSKIWKWVATRRR